jgi:molybdenum cofactor cytidylyltransferase
MTDDLPEILSVAALILAAGSGSRMGRLKQVMPVGGGTLLWHVIDTAMDAALGPVIVVVGAEAETVRDAVAHKDVIVAENPDWEAGMGSSIAAGMRALQQLGEPIGGVAILLADQPKITARHLSSMRVLLQTPGADAVAAEYGDTVGVPAFFSASCFDRLAELPANSGAKPLLLDGSLKVVRFALPEAAIDIDTPKDLKALD